MFNIEIPQPTYSYVDEWNKDRGQKERLYYIEGSEPMPSVTTVLDMVSKPSLMKWMQSRALSKAQELALATPWPEKPPKNENARKKLEEDAVYQRRLERIWKHNVVALIKTARGETDRIRDEAANYGRQAHNAIQYVGRGGSLEDIDEQLIDPVLAYQEWRQETGIEVVHQELMVWHPEHQYAGTIDAIGFKEGSMVVIDWKTGGALYPEAALQVSAYAAALSYITSHHVSECWVVRIPRTDPGEPAFFEQKRVLDWQNTFEHGFKPALNVWNTYRRQIWA
jgi:hypothetical protein